MVHDILAMLIGTQMVHLCIYCNHFAEYSQILNLKNFQGLLISIHPLDFSWPHVLKTVHGAWKTWISLSLGYTSNLILFTKNHLLYLRHLCGPPIPLRTPIPTENTRCFANRSSISNFWVPNLYPCSVFYTPPNMHPNFLPYQNACFTT
jgi:hypothetical protein